MDLADLKAKMMDASQEKPPKPAQAPVQGSVPTPDPAVETDPPREIGGRGGLDPTRYGDWERAGRCIDF